MAVDDTTDVNVVFNQFLIAADRVMQQFSVPDNSCTLTADVAGRQHLRSASQQKLIVPRYRLNSFGRRGFAVPGQH